MYHDLKGISLMASKALYQWYGAISSTSTLRAQSRTDDTWTEKTRSEDKKGVNQA